MDNLSPGGYHNNELIGYPKPKIMSQGLLISPRAELTAIFMVSFFICSMTAANPKQKRSRTLLIIDMIEKLAYVFCDLPHRLITTCKLQVCLTFTKNLSIGTK